LILKKHLDKLCPLLKNRYHNIDSKGCNLLKKQQKRAYNAQSNYSLATIVLFVLFSAIFIISPFFRGLFFHEEYYWVSFLIQLLLLFTILINVKGTKELLASNKTLFVLVGGVVLLYTVSYWYSSSPFYAANEGLQWFSYMAVFMMLWMWMTIYSSIKEWIWLLCWVTLLWIVGLVFLVDLGRFEFQDAILGKRFSSVFQYPNTFASIVSAFVVAGLVGVTKRAQIHYQVIYGMSIIPFMICFLLADSRGGFLVLAMGLVIALIFLTWKEQVLYLFYTGLAIVLGLWGMTTYRELITEKFYFNSALVIIGLSVVFTIIVVSVQFLINRRYSLFSQSKFNFVLPMGLVGTGLYFILSAGVKLNERLLSLFPETLQTRIQSINLEQHSVQERLLFYKDSLVVWSDHLWFGAGGGGWRALFESYKSLPYHSTQAHSFYMQTLVEVGLIGSIFVFGFFIYVLFKGVWTYFILDDETRRKNHLLAPALVAVTILMLHNAIDFNMSFGTYNLFLFVLLAIIWSYIHKHNDSNEPVADSIFSKLKEKLPSISYKQKNRVLNGIIAIIIVSSLFSVYKSYAYAQAEGLYKQAQQGGDFDQTSDRTDRAIALNPNDPKLREIKLQLLNHAYNEFGSDGYLVELDEEHQTLIKLAPTHFAHYLRYAEYLWSVNRGEEALGHLGKALELAPWQQVLYEENINYRLDYTLKLKEDAEMVAVENQVEELLLIMNQLEDKLRIQKEDVPVGMHLTNPIRITNDNRQLFGKAYYYLGNFTKSLEYLSGVQLDNLDDSSKQRVLLYTILSYQALDQQDKVQELLNTDIAKELTIDVQYLLVHDDPLWLPLLVK
jgi:tetratricopeptide (TPR) repeat protein